MLLGHGGLIAGRNQLEVIRLRSISAKALAAERCLQVVEQHRRLAHGKHTGLRARRVGQVGAVPNGEDVRISACPQLLADIDKAMGECKAGLRKPGIGAGAGRADGEIRCEGLAVRQFDDAL